MPVRDLAFPQATAYVSGSPIPLTFPRDPASPPRTRRGPSGSAGQGLRRTGAALGAQVRDQAARETQVHFIPCSASWILPVTLDLLGTWGFHASD